MPAWVIFLSKITQDRVILISLVHCVVTIDRIWCSHKSGSITVDRVSYKATNTQYRSFSAHVTNLWCNCRLSSALVWEHKMANIQAGSLFVRNSMNEQTSVSVSWSRSSRGVGKKLRAVVLFTESVTMYVKTWSFLMFGLTNWNRAQSSWNNTIISSRLEAQLTRHHAKYVCCVITWNGNSFVNECVLQVTSQDSKAFLSQCLEFCWQDKSGWAPGRI